MTSATNRQGISHCLESGHPVSIDKHTSVEHRIKDSAAKYQYVDLIFNYLGIVDDFMPLLVVAGLV